MARKLHMTQGLEDALKKANVSAEDIAKLKETEVGADVERLDLDSLDGVSGGTSTGDAPADWQCPDLGNMTWTAAADFVQSIYDCYGPDVAISVCREAFGPYSWEELIRVKGPRLAVLTVWSYEYARTAH